MDQPQPVSQVLSVPTQIVMTQILSTIKCCALSCPHDLESGVLSDTHVDRPCGEGGPMLQSQQKCLCWHPQGDPTPKTHQPAENRRPHRGIEAGQSVLLRVARPWRGALGRGAGAGAAPPGRGSFHHRSQNCESRKPRDPCQTGIRPCFRVPCALKALCDSHDVAG